MGEQNGGLPSALFTIDLMHIICLIDNYAFPVGPAPPQSDGPRHFMGIKKGKRVKPGMVEMEMEMKMKMKMEMETENEVADCPG